MLQVGKSQNVIYFIAINGSLSFSYLVKKLKDSDKVHFFEDGAKNKKKVSFKYLVLDINSPIHFHQSTNIFLRHFGVMIILMML